MPVKIWLLFLFYAFSLTTAPAVSSESMDNGSHVVTGTLKELDLPKMSGKIITDRDQTIAFKIKNLDLFKGLSVGQHIAVRLDDHGRAIKVMETTIPELPTPEK